jgi:flagellar basal-body rod protein FlgB
MFIDNLLNRGAIPVLEQVMKFTEERHSVLANNVSNFDTVGYKMQDLPVSEFNAALQEAVVRRESKGGCGPLELNSTRHFQWDSSGRMQTTPIELTDNNILFHDENNRFVEKQMSEMAKNTLRHNVTVEMLRSTYNGLETAIRGKL